MAGTKIYVISLAAMVSHLAAIVGILLEWPSGWQPPEKRRTSSEGINLATYIKEANCAKQTLRELSNGDFSPEIWRAPKLPKASEFTMGNKIITVHKFLCRN